VSVTDAGRAFVEEAKLALQHNERAVQSAKAAREGIESELFIGRSPYADPILISTVLAIRLPLYPKLNVTLHSDFAPELVQGLSVSKLDLALIADPGLNPNLTSTKVTESPFYIAMLEDSPLAAMDDVTLSDLSESIWILFDRKIHPALHDDILRRSKEENIVVRNQNFISTEEAVHLVLENVGVAFLPKSSAERITEQGVVVRPLRDKELRIEICLASRADNRSKLVSEFARAFMRRITQVLNPPQMTLPMRLAG
jgi:DNA-binding transcriptional LysR family regulator